MITDTPNVIIQFFNSIWFNLCVIETNVYHQNGGEIIYYLDNGSSKQWIFFQDNKNDRFWCNNVHFWSFFDMELSIPYGGVQTIVKMLVENGLNNNITTPLHLYSNQDRQVENGLNNNIAAPKCMAVPRYPEVENALDIKTPEVSFIHESDEVVNALDNNAVSITLPIIVQSAPNHRVKNALDNESYVTIKTPDKALRINLDGIENALKK
jgi:hypothetical protein